MSPSTQQKLTAGRVAANLRLTVNTFRDHLGDDPVTLALQISRRLPERPVRWVSRGVAGALSRGRSAVGAVAQLILGREDAVRTKLTRLAEQQRALHAVPHRQRDFPHLASVAIAMNEFALAEDLLPTGALSEQGRLVRARLLWQQGQMSAAIAQLQGGGTRNQTLGARYQAEQRVFNGWRPRVAPVGEYTPLPNVVLHVLTNSLPHSGSGYAQRSHSILSAEQDLGWDVSAVTRVAWPVSVGKPWAADADVVDGVRYQRLLPGAVPPELDARLQRYAEELARVVREVRPRVLHTTTDFFNALAVSAVAEAFALPWVYEVRGQLADTWASARGSMAYESERYRLFREREVAVAESADAVVTLGEAMKAELVRGGVDAAKISICPNAVGGQFLEGPLGQSEAIARLGLDPEATYIGTVSSLVGYEGIDDLIDAFAEIAATYPKARLLIAGDGAALPPLQQRAAERSVASRVDFVGRVCREDASLYHSALSIFAVPRKDLSVTRAVTPLKSVEASASGRPVVASRLPALEELVFDGETGLLFTAESPGELATTLERLIEDAELRERLGQQGRAWALANRTWAANAATYDRIYRQLIEERES